MINAGRVEQFGRPLELYHRPANLFVATFLGSPTMNVLEAVVERADGDGVWLRRKGLAAPLPVAGVRLPPGTPVRLGIRPEHLDLAPASGVASGPAIVGAVEVVEALGESHLLHVREAGGARVVVRRPGDPMLGEGARVGLTFEGAAAHLFAADGIAVARATSSSAWAAR